MLDFTFYGKTHAGRRRSNNEDAFIIAPHLGLCLVADGMGGAAAGEIASKIFSQTAIEVFADAGRRSSAQTTQLVRKVFELANHRILSHAETNPDCSGMGCTAEVLALSDTGVILGHVGDSRTYALKSNHLKQLTEDHSLVQAQVNSGTITPAQARNHSMRNVILRAVGVEEHMDPDLVLEKAAPGDLFLLCSDGLTDMLTDEQILGILLSPMTLPLKADMLIDHANEAGGNDNITVVIAEVS